MPQLAHNDWVQLLGLLEGIGPCGALKPGERLTSPVNQTALQRLRNGEADNTRATTALLAALTSDEARPPRIRLIGVGAATRHCSAPLINP